MVIVLVFAVVGGLALCGAVSVNLSQNWPGRRGYCVPNAYILLVAVGELPSKAHKSII